MRSRAVFTADVGGGPKTAGMKKEMARVQRKAWNETWQEGVDVDTDGYLAIEDDPLDAFASTRRPQSKRSSRAFLG